jgi:hypothetical protein
MKKYNPLIILLFSLLLLLSCGGSETVNILVVDESMQLAGTYDVIWDQRYNNGGIAPDGHYIIEMITDNFHGSLDFEVTPLANSGSFGKIHGGEISLAPIPESYAIRINKSRYMPGEAVEISYDLPQNDNVKIIITWVKTGVSPL